MDEWDKIILAKPDISEDTEDTVSVVPKEVPAIVEEKTEEVIIPPVPVVPLKKSDFGIVSEVKVEKNIPIFLKQEEITVKALPSSGILSPYISKLPMLFSMDLANKFATIALALAISFGVYSFSAHVHDLGFEKTFTGTYNSIFARISDSSNIVASLFERKNNESSSQLASPFAAVEVIDADRASPSGIVSFREPDNVFLTDSSFVDAAKKLRAMIATNTPEILVEKKLKPAQEVIPVISPPKEVTPAPSKPVVPVVPQVVMKDGMYIVSYENTGFNPKSLEINRGKTVQFVNNSAGAMRVSDTTGNAISRTFFQPRTVGNGGVFEYTFNDIGIYEYANQSNPGDKGTVVVK